MNITFSRILDGPVKYINKDMFLSKEIGLDVWVKAFSKNGLDVTEISLLGLKDFYCKCNLKISQSLPIKILNSTGKKPVSYFTTALKARKLKGDVVYYTLPSPTGVISLLISSRSKIRIGFMVGFPEKSLQQKWGLKGLLIGKVLGFLTKLALNKCEISIFVSEDLKNNFLPNSGKGLVIPDSKYLSDEITENKEKFFDIFPKIIFAGRFSEEKGIDILLKAAKPDWKLQFAGSGPLEHIIKNKGELLGWLSIKQLREKIGQADVLVLPSYTEGLPNVILDAMMVGTPVVASNVGGIPELLQDGRAGILVPPGNPVALRNAIELILKDEVKRKEVISNGYEVAKSNALDIAIKPLTDRIKQILDKKA